MVDEEQLSLCDKLSKLNFKINDLQTNKIQLDEVRCKFEKDVDDLTEKNSE